MFSYNQKCHNGEDCYFKKQGSCWFQHTEGKAKEEKILNKEIILNKWEDWQLVELTPRHTWNVKYLTPPNVTFHEDYNEESYDDQEESEDEVGEDEEEDKPFYCGCNHNETVFNPLIGQILLLPPELQLKIFRKLDLESLLSIELSSDLLRDVLQIPGGEDLDEWLRMELYRQDLGIILVPDNNSLFLSNDEGWNNECFHSGPRAGPMNFRRIQPGLKSGLLKVRQLEKGFDLARLDQQFISTQCGPRQCFPTFFHNREWEVDRVGTWAWAASLISRGFTMETEDRPDLAPEKFLRRNFSCDGSCCEPYYSEPENYCSGCDSYYSESEDSCSECPDTKSKFKENISRKSDWMELGLSGSIFIISLEDGWWQRRWTIQERKSYCEDDVTVALREDLDTEKVSRLGIITSGCCDRVRTMCGECTRGGGRVVAYVLSNYSWRADGGGFCSFNPQGPLPQYSEAEIKKFDDLYEDVSCFSISRYGYSGDKELSGFILTGDITFYGRPAELLEEGEDFPDREFYD